MSDGTGDGKPKRRGWKWWLGILLVLGILSDNDNDEKCSVGDEAFLRAIAQAVEKWTVGEVPLFATTLNDTQTDQSGVVLFSAAVAADNGWKGTALGSVRLRRCRATVDEIQEQKLQQP